MNRPLALKRLDFLGQLCCGFLPLVWAAWTGRGGVEGLFRLLIFLGAWQLLSAFLHIPVRTAWKAVMGRNIYFLLLILLGLAGLAALTDEDFTLIFLYSLLFSGPVLGIFYFLITATELFRLTTRPGPYTLQ